MDVCSSGVNCDIMSHNHMVDISVLLLIHQNWRHAHQVHTTGWFNHVQFVSMFNIINCQKEVEFDRLGECSPE